MEIQDRGLGPPNSTRSLVQGRPLRILHLLEAATPGGREQWVLDIASRLEPSRFDVTVGFRLGSGPMKSEFERAGIRTYCWDATHLTGVQNLWRWVALVRRNAFDIIHTHPGARSFRALARLVGGSRTIAHVHGLPEEVDEAQGIRLCRRALTASDLCLVSTHWLARKLQANLRGTSTKIEVLHNGVNTDRFQRIDQRNALRTAWGFPPSVTVIGTVARLVPNKGLDTLLRAVAVLVRQIPELRLVVVGDGTLRNELEALSSQLGLANCVRFLGWRTDVPEILSAIDLFALASRREGFPLAPLEAMAAGKPVLLSDLPVYREILPPALWPFLIPPEQLDEWVNRLRTVVCSTELRSYLMWEQRQTVLQFGLSRSLARLEEIYSSLVV